MLAYMLAFNPRSKATDIGKLLSWRFCLWLDLLGKKAFFFYPKSLQLLLFLFFVLPKSENSRGIRRAYVASEQVLDASVQANIQHAATKVTYALLIPRLFSSVPTQKKKKPLPLLSAAIYGKGGKDFFFLVF